MHMTLRMTDDEGRKLFDGLRTNGLQFGVLSFMFDDRIWQFRLAITGAHLHTGGAPDREYGTTCQLDLDLFQLAGDCT